MMRAASLDVLAGVQTSFKEPNVGAAMHFALEMAIGIEGQMSIASQVSESVAGGLRQEAERMMKEMAVEAASWNLVKASWRSADIRAKDLMSRRLNPLFSESSFLFNGCGYEKAQRIVEWLENLEYEALERSGGVRLKPLEDPAYRWEYTAVREECAAVSMDFPIKGGVLDEVEEKAEARLGLEIFRLVRAGRGDEAEEICRQIGQPWRAAALGGGKNCSEVSGNGKKGYARKTWRKAASTIAKSTSVGIGIYERAVYGLFSGVLEPVLAVSKSFEDEAWARLCVLLDATAEKVTSGSMGEVRLDDEDILQAFMECSGVKESFNGVDGEVMEGIRWVRAYISMGPNIQEGHVSKLLEILAGLAQIGAGLGKEWVCRFCAHIALFLKLSGKLETISERPEDMGNFDEAVEVYVKMVIRKDIEEEQRANKQGSILPANDLICNIASRYLSEITSTERIIFTYSGLLYSSLKSDLYQERAEGQRVGVVPREVDVRRTLCLQKAGQCFKRDILSQLVIVATDLVWKSALPELHPKDLETPKFKARPGVQDAISDADNMVIRAIEFLTFPAFANYQEALLRVTKAARRFFLHGKHKAARHVISFFPNEIVSQVSEGSCAGAIHELNSWRIYMTAVSNHNEWNVFNTSRRPTPVPERIRANALTKPGDITYEKKANARLQVDRFNKENAEFQKSLKNLRDTAINSLKSALDFDEGWMSHPDSTNNTMEHEENSTSVSEEISAVRRVAVPQLAVLLHHVLHESCMYSDAIGLAAIIADEQNGLYKTFGSADMAAFLNRIADSTVLYADSQIKEGKTERPYTETLFEEVADVE